MPPETAARWKRLTNSVGALTRPLVTRLRNLFPGADLYPMYGLTEAFRSTYLEPSLVDSHPDSMGTAIPFAEILVMRPDGSPSADDEPGELARKTVVYGTSVYVRVDIGGRRNNKKK